MRFWGLRLQNLCNRGRGSGWPPDVCDSRFKHPNTLRSPLSSRRQIVQLLKPKLEGIEKSANDVGFVT